MMNADIKSDYRKSTLTFPFARQKYSTAGVGKIIFGVNRFSLPENVHWPFGHESCVTKNSGEAFIFLARIRQHDLGTVSGIGSPKSSQSPAPPWDKERRKSFIKEGNMNRKYIKAMGGIALALLVSSSAGAVVVSGGRLSEKNRARIEENKSRQIEERRKQITGEAVEAIQETKAALRFLDEDKKKQAVSALERASGRLDILLARTPKLDLAPVNVDSSLYELLEGPEVIQSTENEVKNLLSDGRIQEARELLDSLRSEIDIRVANIPLATYPQAIKDAAQQLYAGQTREAAQTLQDTLDTLVVEDTVIPLPVVSAQVMLDDAKELVEKNERTNEEKKELGDLLEDARGQLEIAQELGYGQKDDFKNLFAELDSIKDKTSQGGYGKGFFAKIDNLLDGMSKKSQKQMVKHTILSKR
jgi:hypothetical protein